MRPNNTLEHDPRSSDRGSCPKAYSAAWAGGTSESTGTLCRFAS
jgi:hypothetical protein